MEGFAKLVSIENGRCSSKMVSIEDLKKIAVGYTEDKSEIRKSGGFCCREELDGLPIIDGFHSPMWDGGIPRYESYEVYNRLSV